MSYRTAGERPRAAAACTASPTPRQTWAPVTPRLAERFTLVAPDLLGHGESATPRGDYSLGAHASGVRDLLTALGHSRVTVVGHSLGGGIAMQFAYQFPERCERLVLVSSGGLGREVHLLLRAAALPGADYVLPLLASRHVVGVGRGVGARARARAAAPGGDLDALARGFASLDNAGSRQAFLHTVRAVIEPAGQRVNAGDRLYLAAALPDADRLGRARLDHPAAATGGRRTRRCPAAGSRSSRAPGTCPTSTTRSASPDVLDRLLRRDGAGAARRGPLAAAAARRRPRRRDGGRRAGLTARGNLRAAAV